MNVYPVLSQNQENIQKNLENMAKIGQDTTEIEANNKMDNSKSKQDNEKQNILIRKEEKNEFRKALLRSKANLSKAGLC